MIFLDCYDPATWNLLFWKFQYGSQSMCRAVHCCQHKSIEPNVFMADDNQAGNSNFLLVFLKKIEKS